MNFKDILATRRKELNLTQKDLAKELNVSDKTISKWENGYSYPDLTIIPKLAQVLKISVNQLIMEDEKELLQEKTDTADQEAIYKYKLMFYMSIVFVTLAFLIDLNMKYMFLAKLNNQISNIMFILFIALSIIIFIFNTLKFRFFFKNKALKKDYDLLTFNYSIILLHIYSFISWWIVAKTFPHIFDINEIHTENLIKVVFFTLIICLISFYIIPKNKTLCNIEISKDQNIKILKIILIVFINFTVISIFISFFMHYLVIKDLLNVIVFPYRFLLLITYIIYAFILRKYDYII